MQLQRVLWAGVLLGCQASPQVTSATPESGPYGTVITVNGNDLDLEGGKIVFEDGSVVERASMLRVSDSNLTFRVPSPARGAYRWVGAEDSIDAGHFEPAPWRPLALSAEAEGQVRLDFAVLGPERVAELRTEDRGLVVLFHDGEAVTRVSPESAGQPAAGVAWAESDEAMGAFVLELDSDPVLRGLEVDLTGTREVSLELPEDATELIGFDRIDGRRLAFVADFDEEEVLKYEWTEDGLEEVLVVVDPVAPTSTHRSFAARGGHAWRVWIETSTHPVGKLPLAFDQTFSILAAYLAPDAAEFQATLEIGVGDDSASYFEVLGVTDQGELVVEFCGKNSDIVAPTNTHCNSVLVAPTGVLAESTQAQGTPRTSYVPLGGELRTLECLEETQLLFTAEGGAGDALLSPCVDRVPRMRLSPTNQPGFLLNAAEGHVVLTRRE